MNAQDRSTHSGDIPSWRQTALWEKLKSKRSPEAEAVRSTFERWLPKIQNILTLGGTSPTDFTLHDAGHAFRVAQRMAQLVPQDILGHLSVYELALLLLSAYLHDIGMTPEQSKIVRHYQYLVTGNQTLLSSPEQHLFQLFLDDQFDGVTAPIAKNTPTESDLRRTSEIITYYARFRHNDWSEEWIRSNLSEETLGTYEGWVNDLITICRSHHEGYSDLRQERFKPRLVGSPATVFQMRYLAVILRVADILEFDPERTPLVLFKHRFISPSSLI
ncbi:MAG: hypothetical protein WCE73_05115, partial [Candidatus Angelobacter sp.]